MKRKEKLFQIGNRLIRAKDAREAVERSGWPPAYIEAAMKMVKEAEGPLFRKGMYSGTTASHARRIGVHVGINVRAGEFWRNHPSEEYKIDRRNARREMARLAEGKK